MIRGDGRTGVGMGLSENNIYNDTFLSHHHVNSADNLGLQSFNWRSILDAGKLGSSEELEGWLCLSFVKS